MLTSGKPPLAPVKPALGRVGSAPAATQHTKRIARQICKTNSSIVSPDSLFLSSSSWKSMCPNFHVIYLCTLLLWLIMLASTYEDHNMLSRARPSPVFQDSHTTLGQQFLNYWRVYSDSLNSECYLCQGMKQSCKWILFLLCCEGTTTIWTPTTWKGFPSLKSASKYVHVTTLIMESFECFTVHVFVFVHIDLQVYSISDIQIEGNQKSCHVVFSVMLDWWDETLPGWTPDTDIKEFVLRKPSSSHRPSREGWSVKRIADLFPTCKKYDRFASDQMNTFVTFGIVWHMQPLQPALHDRGHDREEEFCHSQRKTTRVSE